MRRLSSCNRSYCRPHHVALHAPVETWGHVGARVDQRREVKAAGREGLRLELSSCAHTAAPNMPGWCAAAPILQVGEAGRLGLARQAGVCGGPAGHASSGPSCCHFCCLLLTCHGMLQHTAACLAVHMPCVAVPQHRLLRQCVGLHLTEHSLFLPHLQAMARCTGFGWAPRSASLHSQRSPPWHPPPLLRCHAHPQM